MTPGSSIFFKTITCPFETEEPKVEFTIDVNLPKALLAALAEKHAEREHGFRFGARFQDLVRYGLKGVKNLRDGAGNPIESRAAADEEGRLVVSEETLQALSIPLLEGGHDTIIDWLGMEIYKANTIAEG